MGRAEPLLPRAARRADLGDEGLAGGEGRVVGDIIAPFGLSNRGLDCVPVTIVVQPRDPSLGKTFYSLRTPRSVFANMSTEQIQTLGSSRGLRIRVDPE